MKRIEITDLERKKLAEAGAASIKTGGWQPIETAPKDGTIIIGYQLDGDRVGISLVSWYKKGWVQSIGAEIKDGKRVHDTNWRLIAFEVTHWQPLPNTPVLGG